MIVIDQHVDTQESEPYFPLSHQNQNKNALCLYRLTTNAYLKFQKEPEINLMAIHIIKLCNT